MRQSQTTGTAVRQNAEFTTCWLGQKGDHDHSAMGYLKDFQIRQAEGRDQAPEYQGATQP